MTAAERLRRREAENQTEAAAAVAELLTRLAEDAKACLDLSNTKSVKEGVKQALLLLGTTIEGTVLNVQSLQGRSGT